MGRDDEHQTIRASAIRPGTKFPEDQPLFLLENDTGVVSLTTVGPHGAETFVLGFTSLERAKAFAAADADGSMRIRAIAETLMSDVMSRPQNLPVALDVGPRTLRALTTHGIGPRSSVTFAVPTRRDA